MDKDNIFKDLNDLIYKSINQIYEWEETLINESLKEAGYTFKTEHEKHNFLKKNTEIFQSNISETKHFYANGVCLVSWKNPFANNSLIYPDGYNIKYGDKRQIW